MKKLGVMAVLVGVAGVVAAAPADKPADWGAVVGKAVGFLKTSQDENGGWSTAKNIGVTGVVTTGLLQCGVSPDDAPVAKGLAFIEALINPKAGHIAGGDPKAWADLAHALFNVKEFAFVK